MARTQSQGNETDRGTFVTPHTPIGLTIAGSDSCAGAGIQADLKTFTALGVYGLTAVTAVVAETPSTVTQIEPVTATLLEAQLELLFDTYPIMAAKTGLLPDPDQIERLCHLLPTWKRRDPSARLVVDPIVVASSGKTLIAREALAAMKRLLLPMADLITPNRWEAEALLGDGGKNLPVLVESLATEYETAVLLKGGHSQDPKRATDLLWTEHGLTEFSASRLPSGHDLHGTGCTLSAAITAALAKGRALEDAVAEGKDYVTRCIQGAHRWDGVSALGHG